jgi:exosortase
MTTRHITISVVWLAVLIIGWPPVRTVMNLGLHDDRYVEIVVAPFLFMFLMYWERNRVFSGAVWSARVGMPLLLSVSMYFVFLQRQSYGDQGSRLVLDVFGVIFAWMVAFILCYGLRCFREAFFPLCCLLLMIPVPASVMDNFMVGLQHGSAAVSYEMLRLFGVPVLAQGMRMSLPGLKIEVAPECSGIRSCLALMLVGVLAGRVCLRSGWNRLALVLATIPIAIFKNAVRISVIASLGAYVDRAFLYGRLHRNGGLVFTPLGVALFIAFLTALQRYESWVDKRQQFARRIPEGAGARTL